MKLAFLLFFIIVLLGLEANAGLPPTTMSGQAEATRTTNFNFFAPNSTATNVPGGRLIETGNNNLLANPSFETVVAPPPSWNVDGTATSEIGTVIHGQRSLRISVTASTLSTSQSSTRYAAQFADGVQGIVSVRVKTSVAGIFVCPLRAGSYSDINQCAAVNNNNQWMLYKVPFVMGGTSNGIYIGSNGVSVTGDVYVDDAYVGTDAGIADTSIITPWQSYTPSSTQGLGTISAVNVRWRQVGSNIEIDGRFQTGTTGASELRFGLPSGFTSAAISGIQLAGNWIRNAANAPAYYVLIEPSVTYFTVGIQAAGSAGLTKQNGNAVAGNNEVQSFFATIPIANLSGSTQVFATQCGANCENNLTARISTAPAVTSTNVSGWISSVTGTTTKTLSIPSGTFTVVPACTCTPDGGSGGNDITCKMDMSTSTTTSLVFTTTNNGATTNAAINVACPKQGADYQSSRTIVGSFKEVVTAPGINKPKTCLMQFGGTGSAASPTACTTGTCIEYYDSCGTGSATFNTTGTYDVVFASGTFANSTSYECTCRTAGSCFFNGAGTNFFQTNASGGFSQRITTGNGTGSLVLGNNYVGIECKGTAP